jgi:hypothetical protein
VTVQDLCSAFAQNTERVLLLLTLAAILRASERPPLSRAKPERAGPNLAIKKVLGAPLSIPRNPSVPGDVHGRIRATTTVTYKPSSKQANLRRKAGVQDGGFYRFTVRGYMYAVMCLL